MYVFSIAGKDLSLPGTLLEEFVHSQIQAESQGAELFPT